ncbi:pantetheine-phosphate adenylyltransferase [Asanoa iriomotensis]|uniref:Phosphopantetheine adenylyltransferase n=1 Tax=Asanoa iriomotensis TaxID=234613 RepID=A0ABQ4BYU0_9ACTN|nr:pantetheine-phosphate adenylyltransferase [Asanoa iriomotensis]GIF55692.1 phosphopantetheine adenylyltransferase [Asanoa iriomotensis]
MDRRPGAHAVYPGTFDPFTAGHVDVVDRVRHLFARVTVLVAVNADKHPTVAPAQRLAALRELLPPSWSNVEATEWSGLTATFCRDHQAAVIVRGIRDAGDLRYESELAAMNENLGIATLFVPARPELTTVSSTAARALNRTRR